MSMKLFLTELRNKKIELSVQDGKLKINAPKGAMTGELMESIKTKKTELIEYIKQANSTAYSGIPVAEPKESYSLSSAQNRLYFLHQYDRNSLVYNIPALVSLDGAIDREKLESTFKQLIKRHESLRTSFELRDGEPVQLIHDAVDFQLEEIQVEKESLHQKYTELIRPFDLEKAPILRAAILRVSEKECYLVMDIHHILADGSSVMILEDELKKCYAGKQLPELSIHYKDFSEWQNKRHQTEAYKEQERYWLDVLSGELPALNLPLDHSRPDVQRFQGGYINFQLTAAETMALRELAEDKGLTTYSLILAIYQVTLGKFTNQEQLLVGSQVAGRNHDEIQGVIGNFVNTLIFKGIPDGEKTWSEYLYEVKETVANGLINQEYKFDTLVEKIVERRDPGRNPIYDAAFVYQNYFEEYMENRDPSWANDSSEDTIAKFDIDLECFETKDHFDFTLHYSRDLFEKQTISNFITYFKHVVSHLLAGIDGQLKDISLIDPGTQNSLLSSWKGESATFSSKSAIALFETTLVHSPNKLALIDGERSITFEELNQQANAVGDYLVKEAGDSELIGVCGGRDIEMVAGILGVLKAGKTFLAIDENYPKERIKSMVSTSDIQVILQSGEKSIFGLESGISQVADVRSIIDEGLSPEFKQPQDAEAAYLIFTSGTSGNPKGVVCSNIGLSHYVQSLHQALSINQQDVFLHTATFSFSSSVRQLFLPLCHGNTLVLAQKEAIEDPRKLFELIDYRRVSVIDLVPSYLRNCLTVLDSNAMDVGSLRLLLTASEPMSATLANKANQTFKPEVQMINMYGQTETTGIATTFHIDRSNLIETGIVSIGKPLPETEFRVLDKYQKMIPEGLEGELCFVGPHLALKYIGDVGEGKFITDKSSGQVLYRTGDLVKFQKGQLSYVGRKDGQLKIRGFRIELEEIAAQGQKISGIQDFLVIPVKQGNEDLLVAYYVSELELNYQDFAGPLSEVLPDYMIPSYFVSIDKVPLTQNGKINKRALPPPNLGEVDSFLAPKNQIEDQLTRIWGEVLGLEPATISVNRNFFELGGHSLRATLLSNKIRMIMQVEVPLKEIFRRQSILQLARYIEESEKQSFVRIPIAENEKYFETSSAQRRLYFLNRMNPKALAYNMPQLLHIEGALEVEKFELAFRRLIVRHEVLRTSFHMVDGVPKQQIHKEVEFKIQYLDDPSMSEDTLKEFVEPFDLSEAPLLRVVLIRKAADQHYFLFDIHHIVTDGVSQGILIRDLIALFDEELTPLTLHYKDYAQWQQTEAFESSVLKQKQYWLNQFDQAPPQLSLPTDFARANTDDTGAFVSIQIGAEMVEDLGALARANQTTHFVTFISILNVFLSRLCGENDIVLGVPSVSRNHADIDQMVGLFLNTLALRNRVDETDTFTNLLVHVGDNFLGAQQNQDYQFEDLLEQLDLDRDLTRNPLFDVFVNYLNFDREVVDEVGGLCFKEVPQQDIATKFDLSFYVSEAEDKLDIALVYKVALFKHETIDYICREMKHLIAQILQSPEVAIKQYQFLDPDELQQKGTEDLLTQTFETFKQEDVESTIGQRFEAQVEKYPNQLALCFGDQRLTYKRLNNWVNQLAHHLIKVSQKSEKAVALLFNMGEDMVVSMLAVTKTGKFYIPIDPTYPIDRIKYTLEDSGATILLTNYETIGLAQRLKSEMEHLTLIDVGDTIMDGVTSDNPTRTEDKSDLAYLLYTSGTTGNPKGVIQSHRNVLHFIRVYTNALHLSDQDRLTLLSNYCFDASVMDIYGALLNGATLYPFNLKQQGLSNFRQLLTEQEITVYHSTPSVFRSAFESQVDRTELEKIRLVVMGGEAVRPQDYQLFTEQFHKDAVFVNGLGPTESTVTLQNFIGNDNGLVLDKVPVGFPVTHTEVLIQGRDRKAAVLQEGEIIYKSDYLALGYWNNREATEKAFLSSLNGISGRFYRSGDMGRLRPGGSIEFLGRIDRQIKVNGYRVELGEIENQLLTHVSVKQVVATIDEKAEQIIAYYTTNDHQEISDLMEYAAEKVAAFMIPKFFIHLKVMPLTTNGKLDKKALPKPELEPTKAEWDTISKTSRKLMDIWSGVLQVEEAVIGPENAFFDVGGDSLKLLQLNDRINQAFGVDLEVTELFRYPTILGMADLIDGKAPNKALEDSTEDEVDGMSEMINLFD